MHKPCFPVSEKKHSEAVKRMEKAKGGGKKDPFTGVSTPIWPKKGRHHKSATGAGRSAEEAQSFGRSQEPRPATETKNQAKGICPDLVWVFP